MNTPAKPEKPSTPPRMVLTSDQHAKLAIAYAVPRLDETPEDLARRRLRCRYHARLSRYTMRLEQQALEQELERELRGCGNPLGWKPGSPEAD